MTDNIWYTLHIFNPTLSPKEMHMTKTAGIVAAARRAFVAERMQKFVSVGQKWPEKRAPEERAGDFHEIHREFIAQKAADQNGAHDMFGPAKGERPARRQDDQRKGNPQPARLVTELDNRIANQPFAI